MSEYLQPICTDYFFILIACFHSCASLIILLLAVLFAKLKEFQIRAKKDGNFDSLYILSIYSEVSEWRQRKLALNHTYFTEFKRKIKKYGNIQLKSS